MLSAELPPFLLSDTLSDFPTMSSIHIRIVHDRAPADAPAEDLHIWKPERISSVFHTATLLSDPLCEFFGLPQGSQLSRTEVTRRFQAYSRDRGLISGAKIGHDSAIRNLLGLKPEDDLNILNLHRYLNPHLGEMEPIAKSFQTWWASRMAPLWVGIDADGLSAEDLHRLYKTLLRTPSVQFVLYTNRHATDMVAPCGCYGRDGVCDYHRSDEEPDTAICGCSEFFNINCAYHTHSAE